MAVTPPSHSPNILMVSGQYPPSRGGIGDYTRCLVNALADAGGAITLIVPTGSDTSHTKAASMIPSTSWGWPFLYRIARFLHESQSDWLHIQFQTNLYNRHPAIYFLPFFLRRWGWKGRVAVTFHDMQKPYLFPKAGVLRQSILNWLACSSTVVIAADSGDISALRNVTPHCVQIPIGSSIPNSVEISPTARKDFLTRHGIPTDKILIGHFGTATGLDTLIAAVSRIPELHLVLIGKRYSQDMRDIVLNNETLPSHMYALIAEKKLETRIHWTGYLPAAEVACAIQICDMIVLPYPNGASLRHSGLAAVLTQGAALITTKPRQPMPGLVEGIHFLAVPSDDVNTLIQVIQKLVSNHSLRKELRMNAKQAASSLLSWSIIAAMHMHVYQGK